MIITNVTVKKMETSDPRYPGQDHNFSDIYLMTCSLDDGTEQECPYFYSGIFAPNRLADMMRLFAGALDRMEHEKSEQGEKIDG